MFGTVDGEVNEEIKLAVTGEKPLKFENCQKFWHIFAFLAYQDSDARN